MLEEYRHAEGTMTIGFAGYTAGIYRLAILVEPQVSHSFCSPSNKTFNGLGSTIYIALVRMIPDYWLLLCHF